MAENRSSSDRQAKASPDQPLLRQGRPADPVPEEDRKETSDAAAKMPAKGEDNEAGAPGDEAGEASTESNEERVTAVEKTIAESRQRKLRLMLRQCDRVMLMDFDILAMPGWPDNYSVAVARRSRDIWLFCSLVAAITFLSGMTGFVPAWIAGGGFGALVMLLLFGLPAVRGLITRRPSYLDLIIKRRRMLQDARKHIGHLEGAEGLVWQCARMAEFNASLRATRFSELRALSERRALSKHITRREHVRLYLMYLLEAEKAYGRAEKAFFEGHQAALDRGWESVAASSEGSA